MGCDIVALVKALQFIPWFQRMKYKIKLKGKNNAILTVTYCPTLNALEKEGEGRENQICNIVDPKWFRDYASFFNSNIRVKGLKTPPRLSKSDICCRWQFTLPG